jgi:hypothetical protein
VDANRTYPDTSDSGARQTEPGDRSPPGSNETPRTPPEESSSRRCCCCRNTCGCPCKEETHIHSSTAQATSRQNEEVLGSQKKSHQVDVQVERRRVSSLTPLPRISESSCLCEAVFPARCSQFAIPKRGLSSQEQSSWASDQPSYVDDSPLNAARRLRSAQKEYMMCS